MIHCKACDDIMPLDYLEAWPNEIETLCDRCMAKLHQAEAAFEWDEILEGTYIEKHNVGGPVAAFWPWEFQYV